MSDNEQDWKRGLTEEQLLKVDELEHSLAAAKANLWQQESLDKLPSRSILSNVVVKIHEASSDKLAKSPSLHSPVSCAPPTSPSSTLFPQPSQSLETSPSFKSLNPGYVSSLAEFWANRWKVENNDFFKSGQECNQHGLENTTEDDTSYQEVNHLKETIMIQCQLFRTTEGENLKLKEDIEKIESINEKILKDLNHKSEIRESLVANLRENLNECNLKISELVDQDLENLSKIVELEKKLVDNVAEMDVVIQENLHLEQAISDINLKFENVKDVNLKLRRKLDEYEEIVTELRNQAAPVENIKVKMASLDQDVLHLKRRILSSRRSKTHISKSTVNSENLTLPFCTSTKKRRWSQAENDPTASPAKIIKIAETTFCTKASASSETATLESDQTKMVREEQLIEVEPTRLGRSASSVKTRSKLGRQIGDCKQQ